MNEEQRREGAIFCARLLASITGAPLEEVLKGYVPDEPPVAYDSEIVAHLKYYVER